MLLLFAAGAGTGKTVTLVEAALQLLRWNPEARSAAPDAPRLLLVAPQVKALQACHALTFQSKSIHHCQLSTFQQPWQRLLATSYSTKRMLVAVSLPPDSLQFLLSVLTLVSGMLYIDGAGTQHMYRTIITLCQHSHCAVLCCCRISVLTSSVTACGGQVCHPHS